MPHRARRVALLPTLSAIGLLIAASAAPAAPRMVGDLPRTNNAPLEALAGVDTEYGELRTADGARLRTIVTRPTGRRGRLPAIQFVQWLSCDTIELKPEGGSGWPRMLRRVIQESNALVLRVEKSGVGDSRGVPCAELDYNTELAHHQAALRHLRSRPDVDPARIVVYGASMGATYAPLIARGQPVAGVATWGGGARTWYERQLAFDRRAMELRGRTPAEMAPAMARYAEFEFLYLQKRMSPADIARQRPELAGVWKEIIGTEENSQYGRPFAFHQQAQQQDWAGAWAEVKAPVLALLGEYDWFEDPRSAELIARIANQRQAGSGEFHLVPGMDHHFSRFPSAEAAFSGKGGTPDPDPAVTLLLRWLNQRLQ